MLIITLNNVKSSIQSTLSVTVGAAGWMELFSSKLNSYLPYTGWNYADQTDTLDIQSPSGTTVPANITDIGTVVRTYDDTTG